MTPEQRAEQVVGYPGSLARDVAAAIHAAVAEEREAIAADLDQQASNLAALFETQWESECDAERVDERRTIAAAIRARGNRCPPA